MKVEKYIKNATNPILPKEAKIMKNLRNTRIDAIPSIHHFGQELSSDGKTMMNIMIMDLLGPSMQESFAKADYRCNLEAALNFGIGVIDVLAKIHAQGVVYRDVKPENFCLSLKPNSKGLYQVYIIDFGLAKHYMVKKEEEDDDEGTFAGLKKPPKMQHIPLSDGH